MRDHHPDKQTTSPLKAIRQKCIECSAGSYAEIEKCAVPECALYLLRSGHRPATGKKRAANPAAIAALQAYRTRKAH